MRDLFAAARDRLGLRAEEALELTALCGTVLSGFVVYSGGTCPLWACLWLLYRACFAVGQTFLSFQWDLLLLEVGAHTGAPLLINTSFNTHGRPIINTAAEAIGLLHGDDGRLDYLVIEDWLFRRR